MDTLKTVQHGSAGVVDGRGPRALDDGPGVVGDEALRKGVRREIAENMLLHLSSPESTLQRHPIRGADAVLLYSTPAQVGVNFIKRKGVDTILGMKNPGIYAGALGALVRSPSS